MSSDIIELHFIDGPLAGTRKMEHKDVISRNRTYRYLEPTSFKPEQLVPNHTQANWVQLVCIEWLYIPISLPRSYNGAPRYAMLLEKGLN